MYGPIMKSSRRTNIPIVSLCWGSFCTNTNHHVLGEEFYLGVCHVSSYSSFSDADKDEKEDAQSPNHSQWKHQCEEI